MWTDERVTLLGKLWAEGLSASQIAKQLGGVTRNAVIGKVHRLGLAGRATPTRPAKIRSRAPRRRVATARLLSCAAVYVVDKDSPEARAEAMVRSYREHQAAIARSLTLEPLKFEDGRAADIHRLNDSMCKFPIGDPGDSSFAFCGRGVAGGVADGARYCVDHQRLCYQPSARRAARNPARRRRSEDKLTQYMAAAGY